MFLEEWPSSLRINISETFRNIPKDLESIGIIRLTLLFSVGFGARYTTLSDKNIPKMALLDRNHLSKLYHVKASDRSAKKLSETFGTFRKL